MKGLATGIFWHDLSQPDRAPGTAWEDNPGVTVASGGFHVTDAALRSGTGGSQSLTRAKSCLPPRSDGRLAEARWWAATGYKYPQWPPKLLISARQRPILQCRKPYILGSSVALVRDPVDHDGPRGIGDLWPFPRLLPEFYRFSAPAELLDEGEGVTQVGRARVFGGEGVLADADLDGAVSAGGADEFSG